MENANSPEYLEKIKNQLVENLRRTAHVPSVQMQDVPRHSLGAMSDEDEAELDDILEDENKDVRVTQRQWEQRIERDNEYEESDNEELDKANGIIRNGSARPAFHDYRNSDVEADSGAQTPVNGNADNVIKSKETDEVVMEDVDAKEPKAEVEAAVTRESEVEAETEATSIAEKEGAPREAQTPARSERGASDGDKKAEENDKTKDDASKGDDEVMQDVDGKPAEDSSEKSATKEPEAAQKDTKPSEQPEMDKDGDVDMDDAPTVDVETKSSEVKKEKVEKDEPATTTTTTTSATDDIAIEKSRDTTDTPKDSGGSS